MLIKSERYKVVFVEVTKCASTTMFRFMLNWHGVDSVDNPRNYLREHAESLAAVGLHSRRLYRDRLVDYYKQHQDYFWFAAVRDPYRRAISNYRNKLNRYAKQFHYSAYVRGKLLQMLSGPRSWADANAASRCIGRYISFDQFVNGLCENGIEFDAHYLPLAEWLRSDQIAYNYLLRVEHLEDDRRVFLQQLADAGVDTSCVPEFAKLNHSDAGEMARQFDNERLRFRINELYHRDVDALRKVA